MCGLGNAFLYFQFSSEWKTGIVLPYPSRTHFLLSIVGNNIYNVKSFIEKHTIFLSSESK